VNTWGLRGPDEYEINEYMKGWDFVPFHLMPYFNCIAGLGILETANMEFEL
jgi:hypothetical protein